ncbi:GNAT family N-acetyltransferase [Candidatus Thorarchaeota archaeon]|nr:MAG: GNAT family N-acetyltransferase [Candidatus Thorarchaeota archaeon]
MPIPDIVVKAYTKSDVKSIAEHLFIGVPENIIRDQREELLNLGPDEVFSVCAIAKGIVVGVCTGVRMKWFGSRHRIEMVQVVVQEDYRGRGVAHQMMVKIAEHFSSRGVEIIQISAESKNEAAIKAYERIGFRQFGTLKNGLKYENDYSDEVMMAAPIDLLMDEK